MGAQKIVLASSVCVYGVMFAEGDVDFPSFPGEESLDVDPMDTYSISKLCCVKVGKGFARRFRVDVYALKIGAVIAPEEYEESFSSYVGSPSNWKVCGLVVLRCEGFGSDLYLMC